MNNNALSAAGYVKSINDMFGVDVREDAVHDAMRELATYRELHFETLRGWYKRVSDTYILLAVTNTVMHNGAWHRYIDHIKATETTIVAQSVINKRLMNWLLRNGFNRTKNHKDWLIWRK